MKKSVITGATSGIGRATAVLMAASGFSLLLVGRREDRLRELQKALQTRHPNQRFLFSVCDVRSVSAVENLVKVNQDFLGDIDVLVNNAGLAKGLDKMQDANTSDWDQMIDTNIKGLLYFTRSILPFMTKNKKGQIVNLGSVAGRWTYPGGGVYCASKFAVRAITEGLRFDLMGTGIRVTNIEPGMVNTEFSLVRMQDQAKADAVYANMIPLSAEDIAETILWCVQRPAHVNIQELVIYPTAQAAVGFVSRDEVKK